jgi:hypothetical protein
MLKLFMLCVALFVASCASSVASRNPEKINEAMITFVTKARAGFWREAMGVVTPNERDDMMDGGQVLPEYKEAIGRIRLSTVKNMDIGLDGKGRLVGIKDVLDESNDMMKSNAERVDIDPSKMEDLAAKNAKKQKEEDERRRKEQEESDARGNDDPDSASFLESLLKQAPKDW